jgi:hypothetical protein
MQPLDRNGNIPLVYQLGETIRDKIVRGEYRLVIFRSSTLPGVSFR